MKGSSMRDLIPSESLKEETFSSHSIDFSNLTSVKTIRASFENLDMLSKDIAIQSNLKTVKDYFSSMEEMANFLDFMVFDLWEKVNMGQIVLDDSLFHLTIFSLSAFEIKILEYIDRLVLGEIPLDLKKIFPPIPKSDNNMWNMFKYSSFYIEIKEGVENKIAKKKFCLKNNVEIADNSMNGTNINNENLSKLIKELKNDNYGSESVINIIASTMNLLLKTLIEKINKNDNQLALMKTIKTLIMAFDLETNFKWNPTFKKANNSLKIVIETLENEEEKTLKTYVQGFKFEEKAMNERLIFFMKNNQK